MTKKTVSHLLIIVFQLFLSGSALAEAYARVIKTENTALYHKGQELNLGTQVVTRENQRLAIKTLDGDIIVLNPNSRIKIIRTSFLSQLFGKIYYFFQPRKQNPVRIQTMTATIGLRGTNFLVTNSSDDDSALISLDEGLLDIISPDDQPFNVHQLKPLDQFEQYKLEIEQGIDDIDTAFDEYKTQIEREFIEYKISVELSSGNTLKIVGHDLFTVEMPGDQQDEIDSFKAFLADLQ